MIKKQYSFSGKIKKKNQPILKYKLVSAKGVQVKQWGLMFTPDLTEYVEQSYKESDVSMIKYSNRSMKVLHLLKFQ